MAKVQIYSHNNPDQIKDVLCSDPCLSERILTPQNLENIGPVFYLIKTRIDEEALGYAAAERFAVTIRGKNGNAKLMFFTGSTGKRMYETLVEMYRGSELSFKDVVTFNLDEYAGLPPEHPETYRNFMDRFLFKHVDINRDNIHFPDQLHGKPLAYGDYEEHIREHGGIDHLGGGIGNDGHMAFIEPGRNPFLLTGEVYLDFSTVRANSRFFDGDMSKTPKKAVTVGVPTIMEARRADILITGVHKAPAAKRAIEEPVGTEVSASFLQYHPDGTYILDGAAASELDFRRLERNPRITSIVISRKVSDGLVKKVLEDCVNNPPTEKDFKRIQHLVS